MVPNFFQTKGVSLKS